jgi:hypothetical protein
MNKSALWTVAIVIIIVLAMGAFVMVAYRSTGSSQNAIAAPSSAIVSYICDGQKIIAAEFSTSSVTMALSDGRSFVLPEIASTPTVTSSATSTSSSTHYEEGSGTNQDVAFVNEDTGAYFMENGSTTYQNCVVNATPAKASSTSTNG